MSADSAVTYTSVHSEARSWSIPSEDPYEEAARQLLEQAPRSPEYVPDPMELEDHVPVYIPEPEHPEDLVPAEDEAPTPLLPPSFLSPRIRPLSPRALAAEMRDVASSLHHSLHPSGTPPLLPIPLPLLHPIAARKDDIPRLDFTASEKRLLLTTPRPECEDTMETMVFRDTERRMYDRLRDGQMWVSYSGDVLSRGSSEVSLQDITMAQKDRCCCAVLRLKALARSEAYCRALEARVTVLETEVHRHEWQRQAADDLVVQHIMRTQALEAGARADILEDTGSSS
ncbi:hypothetical protein Tco_0477413 [Tanacetum coccineum]